MKTLIACLILIQLPLAHSADLDKDSEKGLDDTKEFLKSPSQREDYFKKNKKAKDMDDKVDALAGSKANKEEIYDLSSQIMDTITREANGNPDKMQAMLLEAQKNPEAFYKKYFNDAQKTRVKSIAEKSDSRKPSNSPPK